MKLLAVHTTVATREQARHLARTLVERQLAACAQLEPIDSVYVWNGALQDEPEVRLVLKTTDGAFDALHAALLELHPYELPEIHAVVLEHVHAPYARWVVAGTQGAA